MRLTLASALPVAFCSLTLAGVAFLSGCGMSPLSDTSAKTQPLGSATIGLSGKVHGGQSPIYNSVVSLYAAGYTGYGSGSTTPLATTLTDVNGNWSLLPATYSTFCTANPNTVLYMTAVGGNTQGTGVIATNNAASVLAAVIGTCGTVSASTQVILNEVTTVATAFALASYINPGTGIGAETIGTNSTAQAAIGLSNALATSQNLGSTFSGQPVSSKANTGTNTSVNTVTVTATPEPGKVITIANILAACVNQVSSAASQCTDLLAAATPPPAASTTAVGSAAIAGGNASYAFPAAQDTFQAALYMALNPIDAGTVASCHTTATTNLQCLFNLASTNPPFQTGLSTQPTDWTIGVTFTASGFCNTGTAGTVPFFNAPVKEDIDTNGNLWFNNGATTYDALGAISPAGVPLACVIYGTTSGASVSGSGLAIDPSGNIWATYNGSQAQGLVEFQPANIATATAPQPWQTIYSVYAIGINVNGDLLLTGGGHSTGDFEGTVYDLPAPGSTAYALPNKTTYSSSSQYSPTLATYGMGTLTGGTTLNTQAVTQIVSDHAGNFITGTNSVNNGIFGSNYTTLAITGYSVTASNTVTFYTATAPPATMMDASPYLTPTQIFASGTQNVIVSGLTASSDATNAAEMNKQGFTVTAISTTSPYSITGVFSNGANGNGNANVAALPTLATTTGTITATGNLITYVGTTSQTNYTSTEYSGFGTSASQTFALAIDSNGYVYEAASCCNISNPGQLDKVLYSSPIFSTPALSHTASGSSSTGYLGGMNGARAVRLDGAGNVWTGNMYPEIATTATLPSAGNYYAVSEIATSGGATAGSAVFTALSPTGTLGTGVCSSNDASTTVAPGCPVNGGFQKANFIIPFDIAIDPSGNVWVPQTGYYVYSATAGTSTFTYNGSSITEIVGAGVPQVTPVSVAVANNQLATKP